MVVDLYLVYQFIKRLTTPFEKWDAYEYGIIDADGNILRKRKDLTKVDERRAWGLFDVLVLKLKRLLEKVPGGKTRIASYAAALWLIKEHGEQSGDLLKEGFEDEDDFDLSEAEAFIQSYIEEFSEEAPVNSAGAGNVAGIGIGPDGDPPVSKKKQKEYVRRNVKPLKRFKDFQ
jgi:hypothetical protein